MNKLIEWVNTIRPENLSDELQKADHNAMQALFGKHADTIQLFARTEEQAAPEGDSLIVVLPGLTGSVLENAVSNEVIWLNPLSLLRGHLNHLDLAADGIHNATPGVEIGAPRPLWVAYAKMVLQLRHQHEVVTFPYDWRLSVSRSALLLRNFIEEALESSRFDQVTLVAHSMGGLVALEYLTTMPQHAEPRVRRVITLGTPFKGSLKTVNSLTNPEDKLMQITKKINDRNKPRQLLITCPGLYETLPAPTGLYDDFNPLPNIDIYDPDTWAATGFPINPAHLAAAATQHERRAQADPQVDLIQVVGTNVDTLGTFGGDILQMLTEVALLQGDGTVVEESAVLDRTQPVYYLQETHVELVLDSAVIESVSSWVNGGSVVGLADTPQGVASADGALRSGGIGGGGAVDEGRIADKIANDEPLTHDEVMALTKMMTG